MSETRYYHQFYCAGGWHLMKGYTEVECNKDGSKPLRKLAGWLDTKQRI